MRKQKRRKRRNEIGVFGGGLLDLGLILLAVLIILGLAVGGFLLFRGSSKEKEATVQSEEPEETLETVDEKEEVVPEE